MIYTIQQTTQVLEKKACEYIENDIIKLEDLMVTIWKPLNFNGKEKNFCLRNNHDEWQLKHTNRLEVVKRQWIEELNLDPEEYRFEECSRDETKNTIDFNLIEYDPFYVPSADDTWEHHEEDKNKGVFKL